MTSPVEQELQALVDLADLDEQLAAGEIDEGTGRRLRDTYLQELATARAAAGVVAEPSITARSRPRLLVGSGILLVAFAATIAIVGNTVEARTDNVLQGIAATGDFVASDYSDETLEAVIATYRDDPQVADQIPYMRFAVAERYFDRNDFQRAFTHYEAILTAEPPPDLFAGTMTRVAWITFVGNGEVDLSLDVIDRAIAAAPDSTEALYVKGQILWCGAGDPEAAAPLFERVLASTMLDPETKSQVETDLALAAAGEPC